MTPIEFDYAIKEETRLKELDIRNMYEVERWGVRHLINISGRYVKTYMKSVEEVEPFPWDPSYKGAPAKKVLTPDEMTEALKGMANLINSKQDKRKKPKR